MAYWELKIVSMSATAFLSNKCLLLLFLLSACKGKQSGEVLPYYNTPDFTPVFLKDAHSAEKRIDHVIAPFAFRDQDGELITDKSVAGKIHIAGFMFTSCAGICPAITKNLIRLSEQFENDTQVVILSYSVTPWMDNEERLKAYKNAYGINNPNWHFLTGDKAEIYTLARKSYFAEEDLGYTKDSTEFLHTEHLILVDTSGRIRGIYNGTLALDITQLIQDIIMLRRKPD